MKRIAIIGGGLAGTACAWVFKNCGLKPVIYEAGPTLAAGASGNPVGLYNPRLSAERAPQSDYHAAAFALAVRSFKTLPDIEWNPCGSLHLFTDEKREKRFRQAAVNWGWDSGHMRLVEKEEASAIAGVDLAYDALWLPDAGTVSPARLCKALARDVPVHLNARIESLSPIEADAVILACGNGVRNFSETSDLPVRPVRGQVTQAAASSESMKLRCNLCYGGYISPAMDGVHMLGATFQRWLDHEQVLPEDDHDNIAGLRAAAPQLAAGLKIAGGRAALRAASPDHMPLIGRMPGCENLYVSAAHGSHGIISALMAAQVLAALILGTAMPLGRPTLVAIDPMRFARKAAAC